MLDILTIVQEVVAFAPAVKAIIDEAESNDTMLQKLESLSPTLGGIISSLGAELFPQASATLQKVGGVLAAFDPNTTKWLQGSLNTVLSLNPPLAVDGRYGPLTKAAVQQFQTTYKLGVDGIAGEITQAALNAVLSKLPVLVTPAPAA